MAIRKPLFSCLLIFTTLSANAQGEPNTFSIIPKVGATLSSTTRINFEYDAEYPLTPEDSKGLKPKYLLGVTAGVDFLYQFTESSGLSLGVFYTQQGYRLNDQVNEELKDARINFGKRQTQLQYITCPLMYHYHLVGGFALGTGLQVGGLIAAKASGEAMEQGDVATNSRASVPQNANNKANKKRRFDNNVKDFYHKVDVAIPLEVSYEIGRLICNLRYSIGLRPIFNFQNDKTRNKSFLLTAGYKFDF